LQNHTNIETAFAASL